MKKRFAKIAALLCALAMAASIVTGCGKQASSDGKTSGSAKGELDTSKEVELVLYVVSDRPAKQDDVEENFNKLFKEKLNCTVKINWLGWAEYRNKYPLIFSSGEKFDMAYSATWLNFSALAEKGAFKNLDELWPQYAPKNFARQSESAKQQATIAGHYYAVPTLNRTYSAYGPTYRTDILKDTDWNGKMETLEDYETYLSYVKKAAPDMEPIAIVQEGSEIDEMFMQQNKMYASKGAQGDFLWLDPAQEAPKLFTYYEYDKTPEFLEMVNRWNKEGYFTKSALSDADTTKVENGKAASRLKNMDTYVGEHIKHPEWGFKFANFVTDVSYMSFMQDGLVISNTSENPERALAWYDLITNDEDAFRAFNYGIEGKSYEIVDNQVNMLNPDDYAESPLWAARTVEFMLPKFGSPTDFADIQKGYDEQIKDGVGAQKFRGFSIDTSSIENEYAACVNVHQQYWWPLELGYTDPVKGLKEYQQKMEAAGIDKVRETLQTQLDEYLKSLK